MRHQPSLDEHMLGQRNSAAAAARGARVDALLNDSSSFDPFVPFFYPLLGRPSVPMEVYLRLMFLKFRWAHVGDRVSTVDDVGLG
jgi:transposase, IS5 family